MSTSNISDKKIVSELRKKLTQDPNLINPCLEEYNFTAKCLEKNKYDYNKCLLYVENYKICKKFWAKIINYRKIKNIKPYIPLPEERQKIKAEYLQSENK
ncbi:Coiled-coil-helix-coiled-coil-helix domain-containing protein [Apis cerana cerana]|uniref:Coiled-coil-helix-coiled-coil-helix domain-containing protein 7 n=1 Tax=Apis cerana cerana TaxID=94128 RepID=A0A2A3EPV8_APICC|nr:Coiled-coil-helix-coiled-coil-helix domain-containing protein [Apis cerana cerana]